MAKLTIEQKLEIYKKRKQGQTVSSLSKEYGIRAHNINYLIGLIDMHGYGVLRKDKNKYYSPQIKLEIINKVLIDRQSINSTAIEYGFSSDGILHNWIKSYKNNGCAIVEKTRERSPTMKHQNKTIDRNNKDIIIKAKMKKF